MSKVEGNNHSFRKLFFFLVFIILYYFLNKLDKMAMTLLKSLQRGLISKFCMLLIISLAFLCSDNADASFKHNRNNSSSWRQHKPRSKHLKIVISAAVNGNGFLDPYLNSITHHSLRRLHPNSPNSSSPKKLKIKLK